MTERPNTISGLMAKRSELVGKIEHHQKELNALHIALDHLDATVRVFDPDADVSMAKVKPYPPRHASYKGEMTRFVLTALKDAVGPTTSIEIAKSVVQSRGLSIEDTQTVILIRKRVGACLKNLHKKGLVRQVPTTGVYRGWVLVR